MSKRDKERERERKGIEERVCVGGGLTPEFHIRRNEKGKKMKAG